MYRKKKKKETFFFQDLPEGCCELNFQSVIEFQDSLKICCGHRGPNFDMNMKWSLSAGNSQDLCGGSKNQNSAESGVAPAPHSTPIPTKR